jgi:hypothetical protein
MGMRNSYKDLDRKPERNSPLGRHLCGREDTTMTDFEDIILKGFHRICVAQDTEP